MIAEYSLCSSFGLVYMAARASWKRLQGFVVLIFCLDARVLRLRSQSEQGAVVTAPVLLETARFFPVHREYHIIPSNVGESLTRLLKRSNVPWNPEFSRLVCSGWNPLSFIINSAGATALSSWEARTKGHQHMIHLNESLHGIRDGAEGTVSMTQSQCEHLRGFTITDLGGS